MALNPALAALRCFHFRGLVRAAFAFGDTLEVRRRLGEADKARFARGGAVATHLADADTARLRRQRATRQKNDESVIAL